MKKLPFIALVIIIMFISSGCTKFGLNKTEIDRIFATRIIGIDKQENGKVLLTLTTKSTSQSSGGSGGSGGGGGGGEQKSDILVSEGETVFEAARLLLESASKKPHFGHTEFILLGEDLARDGLLPYLDFISRNHEFRYNAKIYIVKGNTANTLINKLNTGDAFLADKLSIMEDNAGNLSVSSRVTLSEAMFIFDKIKLSTYLPYLELVTVQSVGGGQSSGGDTNLELRGYGIFKGDKLQEFLTADRSRGINWLRNKVQSGVILLQTPQGKPVSMEIISAKTIFKPHMNQNGLQCDVRVSFGTNIAEIMAKENIFTEQEFKNLEGQQEQKIRKEIEDTIAFAQSRNMDFFGVIIKFTMANPRMKNELRENWDELFPEVKFNVTVDSSIERTYLLREPTGSQK